MLKSKDNLCRHFPDIKVMGKNEIGFNYNNLLLKKVITGSLSQKEDGFFQCLGIEAIDQDIELLTEIEVKKNIERGLSEEGFELFKSVKEIEKEEKKLKRSIVKGGLECSDFDANDVGFVMQSCNFLNSQLPRIVGIIDIGTSRFFFNSIGLAKVNRRKVRNIGLSFVSIDTDTANRWKKKFGTLPSKTKPVEFAQKKDYMDLFGIKGKNSGVTFHYRPNEMNKILKKNPTDEKVFF